MRTLNFCIQELPGLRHDRESHLPGLNVKNSIGRVALDKDRLLFCESHDLPSAADGRKEFLGIEFAAFLGRCGIVRRLLRSPRGDGATPPAFLPCSKSCTERSPHRKILPPVRLCLACDTSIPLKAGLLVLENRGIYCHAAREWMGRASRPGGAELGLRRSASAQTPVFRTAEPLS